MITLPVWQARLNNSLDLLNNPSGVGQTATQYARVTRTTWQDLGETVDSYTIFGRVKFRSLTAGSMIVGSNADNGATTYPFKIDTNNNKLRFTIYDGTNAPSVSSTTSMAINTWYDFACVRHVDDDKLYVYLGPSLAIVAEGETADTTTNTCKNTKKMGIGHDGGLSNAGNIRLSDLRVFNRALTLAELQDISANGLIDADAANPSDYLTTLIGWWKLAKNLQDSTSNRNDMTTVECSFALDYPVAQPILTRSTASNRFLLPTASQKSLQFNGSSDLATVPITPATTGFCFGIWIDPLEAATNSSIIAYVNNTNGGFKLFRSTNQSVGFFIKNVTTSDVNLNTSAFSVRSGRFTHLVVTYAPNDFKMYIRGSLVSSDTSIQMTDPDVAQSLTLGRNSFGASAFANIRLSRFAFQNTTTPWTAEQVSDLYYRNIVPSGASYYSLNNTNLDQDGLNGLTLTGTTYASEAPLVPRSIV